VLAAALPSANSDRQAKFLSLLQLTILVPVFNDWAAAELLVEQLDSVLGEHALSGHLLSIDDGSLGTMPEQFPKIPPHNIPQIQTGHGSSRSRPWRGSPELSFSRLGELSLESDRSRNLEGFMERE
jgi:hypothetical protein